MGTENPDDEAPVPGGDPDQPPPDVPKPPTRPDSPPPKQEDPKEYGHVGTDDRPQKEHRPPPRQIF